MRRKRSVLYFMVSLAFGMMALGAAVAGADEPYPTRPLQIIVPFPPGGVADLVTFCCIPLDKRHVTVYF